ncbi:cyclopropane-fatty-acyl-phospholipid synthase family protein [Gammaproteobacteria bacterium]|nr:cyclopropane-fatty-acyl-phospholipid synthase family protein [Gammaproteobacteria bacterium]
MRSAALCIDKNDVENHKPGILNGYAKRILLKQLEKVQHGELILNDGVEQYIYGRQDKRIAKTITINIHDSEFYRAILVKGDLGGGEAYINGCWSCDDLTGLVELFICNSEYLEASGLCMRWFTKPLQLLQRFMRRNTRKGSRRNIEAHYDIGNDLFEQFLDNTMMYSCGIFHHEKATLQEASEAKLERVCQKLQLKPTDHVLEIGTGWGGFAVYAASRYGCRVTTTTISREQHEYAAQRIRKAGLEDRINLLYEDYRKLEGSYDKLVSIEMIEAIGHRYYDTYFNKCTSLLKPDGMMLLQSITIADQRYADARKSIDYIQRYIFPGGCLPSVAVLSDAIARKTDMRIFHLEDIGPHYATTLRLWRERFFANIEKVAQLGYTERFIRMWQYYLCYCEGGFRQQSIGTVQLLLTKPQVLRTPLTSTDC